MTRRRLPPDQRLTDGPVERVRELNEAAKDLVDYHGA